MWSSLKTHALIIAAEPFKEADRKYRALTRDFGKIEFVGRGASKGKAKLAAHLDPFALVQLELVVGKRQTTVIGAERVHTFPTVATSLEHRLLAQAAHGLLDKTLKPDLADEDLYHEVLGFMSFLDNVRELPSARGAFVLGGFLLRIMSQLGYETELDTCLSCKNAILPLSFRWHDLKGGLVCTECVLKNSQEWYTARTIEEETVALLRFARESAYEDLAKTSLRSHHVQHFSSCVHDLMRIHVPGYSEKPYWEGVMV